MTLYFYTAKHQIELFSIHENVLYSMVISTHFDPAITEPQTFEDKINAKRYLHGKLRPNVYSQSLDMLIREHNMYMNYAIGRELFIHHSGSDKSPAWKMSVAYSFKHRSCQFYTSRYLFNKEELRCFPAMLAGWGVWSHDLP